MALRYREIREGDSPDKGSHGGSCNTRACMKPKSAFWYNECTDSYYCGRCADNLNEANYSSAGHAICTRDNDGSKEQ